MGMIAKDEQEKSQLVTDICELSARAISCSNRHPPRTNKSTFIDWYLVLRVDENADIYSIRKQYHKLALQLHPDKNKHSKAETAFKLVSEAYYCLSNITRRATFDSERKTFFCIKCNPNIAHINTKTPKPHRETSGSSRIQRRMKELRNKLMDEVAIIDKCLISITTGHTNAYRTRTEMPVFNPSDYQYKGYPHHRTMNCTKLEDLRGGGYKMGNRWMNKTANYESPVFEYRSPLMARCSSTRDC